MKLRVSILLCLCFCPTQGRSAEAIPLGEGVATAIQARCTLVQQDLGMTFSVGKEHCAVLLEITNGELEDLEIGADLFLAVPDGKWKGAVLVSGKNGLVDETQSLPFASGAYIRTCVDGGQIKGMGFVTGDFAVLQGEGFKGYQGTWPVALPRGATVKIAQRLFFWPGSTAGWFASPILKAKASTTPGFRLLGSLGSTSPSPMRLSMSIAELKRFVADLSKPMPLREWAVGWLAARPEETGWRSASMVLTDAKAEPSLREAAARWLATQAPPAALEWVNKVMWDKTTPEQLQLTCYYSLTWSEHKAAKPFIEAARNHPYGKIATSAQSQKL
jgi:hypothetical protein